MRYAILAAALVALSGLALAQEPAENSERLRLLRRDLPLIHALVEEGLNLADQEDPVARARTCNVLADKLVQEFQQAAVVRDEKRAADMGQYLQAVLVAGWPATSDRCAAAHLPSPPLEELRRICDRALRVTQPVVEDARREMEQKKIMQPAIDAIARGRKAVENAVAESSQPRKP